MNNTTQKNEQHGPQKSLRDLILEFGDARADGASTDEIIRIWREVCNAIDQQAALSRPSAIRAQAMEDELPPLPFAILPEEMKALKRFHDCVSDGEGYDVPKEMMKRLAIIGVVRRVTANYYEHTEFGLSILDGGFAEDADAIRSLASQPVQDGWASIETAPKGANGYAWMDLAWGPEDDKCCGSGMRVGDKFFASATFYCVGKEKQYELREIEVTPTHWRIGAAAPTAAQRKGEE